MKKYAYVIVDNDGNRIWSNSTIGHIKIADYLLITDIELENRYYKGRCYIKNLPQEFYTDYRDYIYDERYNKLFSESDNYNNNFAKLLHKLSNMKYSTLEEVVNEIINTNVEDVEDDSINILKKELNMKKAIPDIAKQYLRKLAEQQSIEKVYNEFCSNNIVKEYFGIK